MKNLTVATLIIVSFILSPETILSQGKVKDLPSQHKKWLTEDVIYIITAKEKEVFLQLASNLYVMRIGSGNGPTQKFRLRKLGDGVYEANAIDASFYDLALGLGRFGVKFYVDKDQRTIGLRIITDRLRRLDFRKVSGIV